jgi:ubiquinone/menaquinone biosynthesis C-methylase UbiE
MKSEIAKNEAEQILYSSGYTNVEGVFISRAESHDNGLFTNETQIDSLWSEAASRNPAEAAAATDGANLFAKRPLIIDEQIGNGDLFVCDAGCGYGRVAIPLLVNRPSLNVVGIDASAVMLRKFCEIVNSTNDEIMSRLILLKSAINDISLPDSLFDCIYTSAVLLHNPYGHIPDIVREFHRLLKPGGTLIAAGSFPNFWNLEGIQNAVYLKIVDKDTHGPVRVYTKRQVKNLFATWSGCEIRATGITLIPRQVGGLRLPFGKTIRSLNSDLERRNLRFVETTSLFTKYFDVIATK